MVRPSRGFEPAAGSAGAGVEGSPRGRRVGPLKGKRKGYLWTGRRPGDWLLYQYTGG